MIDPSDERTTGRGDLIDPFERGGLLLDKGVGRGDREDGFAASQMFFAGRIAIVQFDAENFGESVADFGHDWRGMVWKRHDGRRDPRPEKSATKGSGILCCLY